MAISSGVCPPPCLAEGRPFSFPGGSEADDLVHRFQNEGPSMANVTIMHNKQPVWNASFVTDMSPLFPRLRTIFLLAAFFILVLLFTSPETKSYVLNFGGRVQVASVKNFQLQEESNRQYLSCGSVMCQFFFSFRKCLPLPLQHPSSFNLAR